MSTPFTGYADPFSATTEKVPVEENNFHKIARALQKSKKKNRKLKQIITEQRAAEEKRVLQEQRVAAEAAKKKEEPLLTRVVDAVVKAIPRILVVLVPFFFKSFFSRKNRNN